MAREDRAFDFARLAHGDAVRRYTGEPYWNHLLRVATMVKDVPGSTIEMVEAAFLHDVLEDTDVKKGDLRVVFGDTVAYYVGLLTDLPLSAGNREFRKADTVARLARAPAEVKTIKLADVLDNGPSTLKHDPSAGKLFLREKALLLPSLKGGDPGLYWKVAKILGVHSSAPGA